MQRLKKIRFTSAITEHSGYPKDFLAIPKGQITFFAPIINYYHSFKERLEILISSIPTNNYYHNFKKGLDTLTSSTSINNYYRNLKEGLVIQLIFTISTSFISGFNIPKDIFSSIESTKTSYVFWYRYCWYSKIKDSIPAAHNLYKYTLEEILYMVLIGNRRSGLDIWPETLDLAKSTKYIMKTT